jgi:mannosyltransferase
VTVSPSTDAGVPPAIVRALHPRLLLAAGLFSVMSLGFALRMRDLGERSLWVDELFSIGLAAQQPRDIATVLYGEEANMTLYYVFMFFWVRLVGASADELWMRLPSVIFGTAGLWALYRLGTRLDRPATGLLAAALAALNAYHIEMSQEARAYTMWALLVTLSWSALLDALNGGHRKSWLRYVMWTTVAFYAHFFSLFVIMAQIIVVAVHARLPAWRAMVVSGVAVAALCLPFLPFFVVNSDGSQILHVRRSDIGDLTELPRLFAGASSPLLWAYGALGALGTAVTLRRARLHGNRGEQARALVPLLWLLVPVLLIFLLSYVKPRFKERYLFAAMPAFPLLAALGIMALRPVFGRLAVALLVAALALMPLLDGLEIRQSENWRSAIAYLEESAQPDDGWIFISKRGQLGYEYYAGRLAGGRPAATRPDILEPFSWDELASSEAYYRGLTSGPAALSDFSARHRRIWLVLSHEFDSTLDGDASESVRSWLSRRGYSARQRSFQNVRVLLYEQRS